MSSRFRDETSSRHPIVVHDLTVEIVAGDVDRDQDTDLFFANVGFSSGENLNRLLMNDGQGFFADETLIRLPAETVAWNNDAELKDFNGDQALDLFLTGVEPGAAARDLLFLNDGMGGFLDRSSTDLPDVLDFSAAAAAGDLDGDMDIEIFVANVPPEVGAGLSAQNRLHQNQSIVSVVDEPGHQPSPRSFQLFASYPNPARAFAMIRYQVPQAQSVLVQIYDLNGRLVRTLFEGERPAGAHAVRWDGRNELGGTVSVGVYFCRLMAGSDIVATRKMLLLQELKP